MPPTRGHDLKLINALSAGISGIDAPHTGARLETLQNPGADKEQEMPPTRGHDLKPLQGRGGHGIC